MRTLPKSAIRDLDCATRLAVNSLALFSVSSVRVFVNRPTLAVIANDSNLGQENPQLSVETEDFPEEFAVDADIENRESIVVDESSAFIG